MAKETLSDIIKKVNKESGNLISVGMKDFKRERIPFTSARMNYCLFGGLPKGQMIEFRGEEHSGKTTSAFDVIANFQNSDDGRKVMYVDTETSFDPEWASKIGVDVDELILFTPEEKSAEYILQTVLNALKTGELGIVVIDSIAAMFSEKEGSDDLDKSVVAGIFAAQIASRAGFSLSEIRKSALDIRAPWISYALMGIVPMVLSPVVLTFMRMTIGENLGWDAAGIWQGIWKISDFLTALFSAILGVIVLPKVSMQMTKSEFCHPLVTSSSL